MTDVLWQPEAGQPSRLNDFQRWLASHDGPPAGSYADLWEWSTTHLDEFWLAVWRFFDIPSDTEPAVALADASMPGASWFPDIALNYAEVMLRMPGRADDDIVVIGRSQSRDEVRVSAADLREQVARARAGLHRLGVGRGDRVAAYSPNIPETLVLLLATASLGATFTSCAPEFGVQSVKDRWQQISPKVVVAVDGYRYGEKPVDRRTEVVDIVASLPSVETLVWLPYLDAKATAPDGAITWADLLSESAPLEFTR
ncbi:MAG: acetoacetate--CoA ligase, partial [Myxococcales bacterium]